MSEAGVKRKNDAAILVVDDNEDNRYTLERRLRRDGYANVTAVGDGRGALEALETGRFDLVLLDVMMPGMSGYEVLERVKADPDLRAIPVIMVSALEEMESVVQCIELGAEDYLDKPFNPTLLRARVSSCLERKRLRDSEGAYVSRVEGERKRAEALLHAVLPKGAVSELKTAGEVRPRRHDHVAVLFCDLAGFTPFCDANPPETVVENLQGVIGRFEDVARETGMEKIKTVGDAMMATAGLLTHAPEPVVAAATCGLGMVRAAADLESPWAVGVGIHVGPVVAGIVGNEPYQFDLWGDTVNTAARLCDQATGGQVLLSGEAWMEARGALRGRSLGFVELKGKGEVEAMQCLGLKEPAAP